LTRAHTSFAPRSQNYTCDADLCFFTLTGYQSSIFGGESINLALINNLLSLTTIAYLSATFQHFTLEYIYYGLFSLLLPLAS